MYFQQHDGIFQVIFLYFDDLLITGSCTNSIGQIKNSLHSEFAMTDLGLLRQFLGLEIEQNGKGIMPSQPQYDSNLLKKFNMAECKAANSPFLSGIKLHEFGNSPMVDITLYRKLVGNFLFLTHTRPDLYLVKPIESRKASIFAYQALGACLSPYSDFFSLHINEGSSWKPLFYCI